MTAGRPQASTYERLRVIGRGGMGEVFLGRQRGVHGFERAVALKRILPGYAADPEFRRLFLAEARAMAALSHPNICQTIELFTIDEDLYLVLEMLEGVSLAALVEAAGELPPEIVAGLVMQACAGLDHAHARGFVHRDLSPSNLFVTASGQLKLLDFGVAKVTGTAPTTSGARGKRPYLSPEQVNGQPVDARSDLFALGAVGLEALTGTAIFERGSDYLTYRAILEDTRQVSLTGTTFEPILTRCLEVDPAARPASARALAQAIRAAVPGGGASPLELSDFVERQMATELADLRAIVKEALAAPPSDAVAIGEHTAVSFAAPEVGDPTGEDLALTTLHARAPDRVADPWPGPAQHPAPRARVLAPLVGGLLVVAAGVGWLVSRAPDARPTGSAAGDASGQVLASAGPVAALAPVARPDAGPPDPPPPDAPRPDAPPPDAPRPEPPPDFEIEPAPRPGRVPGQVSIDAVPFATISIDGKDFGPTPVLKASLAAGRHRVTAIAEDGRKKRFTIVVRSGALTVERVIFR